MTLEGPACNSLFRFPRISICPPIGPYLYRKYFKGRKFVSPFLKDQLYIASEILLGHFHSSMLHLPKYRDFLFMPHILVFFLRTQHLVSFSQDRGAGSFPGGGKAFSPSRYFLCLNAAQSPWEPFSSARISAPRGLSLRVSSRCWLETPPITQLW